LQKVKPLFVVIIFEKNSATNRLFPKSNSLLNRSRGERGHCSKQKRFGKSFLFYYSNPSKHWMVPFVDIMAS